MKKNEKIEFKYRVVVTDSLLNKREDGVLTIYKETIYALLDINNLYCGVFDEDLIAKHIDELFKNEEITYRDEDENDLVVSREELLYAVGSGIEERFGMKSVYDSLNFGDNQNSEGNIYLSDGMWLTPEGNIIED